MERDKTAQGRQYDNLRKELEAESLQRAKAEKLAATQKKELITLRDRTTKYDKELNKVLTDLKNREWEVKQLESKQDKTIVEHVHVLEEAKRVTDRQLDDAQKELARTAAYIRSLEKAKSRLTGEAEDLARETERERLELRAKEKDARTYEARANQTLAELQKERLARLGLEEKIRKMEDVFRGTQNQVAEVTQQLLTVQRSKDNLETELARLADDTETPDSLARVQRQYESRISELQTKLDEAETSRFTSAEIKKHIDRQHADIRRLILDPGPQDEDFRTRLLRELETVDEKFKAEIVPRRQSLGTSQSHHHLPNITPTKRRVSEINGQKHSRKPNDDNARLAQKQVAELKQQVGVLEVRIAASDRVRQHLEASLREMSAELENSDGSKAFLERYKARLAKENARLSELLKDEEKARRSAQDAQTEGVQEIFAKFQVTMQEERENYLRLDESRKALVNILLHRLDYFLTLFLYRPFNTVTSNRNWSRIRSRSLNSVKSKLVWNHRSMRPMRACGRRLQPSKRKPVSVAHVINAPCLMI